VGQVFALKLVLLFWPTASHVKVNKAISHPLSLSSVFKKPFASFRS